MVSLLVRLVWNSPLTNVVVLTVTLDTYPVHVTGSCLVMPPVAPVGSPHIHAPTILENLASNKPVESSNSRVVRRQHLDDSALR